MTARDEFAMRILQGFCANPAIFAKSAEVGWGLVNCTAPELMTFVYRLADTALAVQPAASPVTDEREAFKAWAESVDYGYGKSAAATWVWAWEAWKARAALPVPEPQLAATDCRPEHSTVCPKDSRPAATFESWWEKSGQFSRAGGGGYEKTFAFYAWNAALAAVGAGAAELPEPLAAAMVREGRIEPVFGFDINKHEGEFLYLGAVAVDAAPQQNPSPPKKG